MPVGFAEGPIEKPTQVSGQATDGCRTESTMLEKTFKIIMSNLSPNTF